MGRLKETGLPIVPSWAYVDDFVVAGPGAQFVRDSIDVYESGLSIGRDSRLLSLMPDAGYGEVSMLVYQNIARSVPQVLDSMLLSKLTADESELAPDLGFLERYHAPGIAYALAAKSYVDIYLNTPTGIDLNMGMAVPLVAKWLAPRLAIGETLDRTVEARAALEELAAAALLFEEREGRLPESLGEIATGDGRTIERVPEDPFGVTPGETLRLIPGPEPGTIILYSLGPDQTDDRGTIEYDPEHDVEGVGDIFVRLPLEKVSQP